MIPKGIMRGLQEGFLSRRQYRKDPSSSRNAGGITLPNNPYRFAYDRSSTYLWDTTTIFGDNSGAVALANCPHDTPHSKLCAIKYHSFREHVRAGHLEVKHVKTTDQLADLLTKQPDAQTFLSLRQRLMGG
jgi:hypothetical protein